MNRSKFQPGSVHLILTLVLAMAVFGILGFVVWQNLNKSKDDDSKTTSYSNYVIGDTLSFADTNWIVIKDSGTNQDSVTAIRSKSILRDVMDEDSSKFVYGSSGYYDPSAAAQYLNDVYLPKIGKENLKDVDGYKIRLIKIEELISLGCKDVDGFDVECKNAPSWVVNSSNKSGMGSSYWTMSEKGDDSVFLVVSGGPLYSVQADGGGAYASGLICSSSPCQNELRPVVNLLKSKIK